MDPDLDYLYGVSPVLNALAANKRAFSEIYVQEVRGGNETDSGLQDGWDGRALSGVTTFPLPPVHAWGTPSHVSSSSSSS